MKKVKIPMIIACCLSLLLALAGCGGLRHPLPALLRILRRIISTFPETGITTIWKPPLPYMMTALS